MIAQNNWGQVKESEDFQAFAYNQREWMARNVLMKDLTEDLYDRPDFAEMNPLDQMNVLQVYKRNIRAKTSMGADPEFGGEWLDEFIEDEQNKLIGFEEKEELTAMDGLRNARKNWHRVLPFVGGAVDAWHAKDLLLASLRIKNGEANSNDWRMVLREQKENQQYAELNEEGKVSFMHKVANVAYQLPAFGLEFLATGGLYTAGRKAAVKGMTEGAEILARRSTLKLIADLTDNVAVAQGTKKVIRKAAEFGVGTAYQTVGLSHRTAGQALQNLTPHRTLTYDEKRDAYDLILDDPTSSTILGAIGRAYGDQYIEVLSERSGVILEKFVPGSWTKKMREVGLGGALARRWLNENGQRTLAQYTKVIWNTGYNGLIEEPFEERVGGVLRAVTGLDDFGLEGEENTIGNRLMKSLPSPGDFAVEVASFAIYGGFMGGIITALARSQQSIPQELEGLTPSQRTNIEGIYRVTNSMTLNKNLADQAQGLLHDATEADLEDIGKELPDLRMLSEDELKGKSKEERENLLLDLKNGVTEARRMGDEENIARVRELAPQVADVVFSTIESEGGRLVPVADSRGITDANRSAVMEINRRTGGVIFGGTVAEANANPIFNGRPVTEVRKQAGVSQETERVIQAIQGHTGDFGSDVVIAPAMVVADTEENLRKEFGYDAATIAAAPRVQPGDQGYEQGVDKRIVQRRGKSEIIAATGRGRITLYGVESPEVVLEEAFENYYQRLAETDPALRSEIDAWLTGVKKQAQMARVRDVQAQNLELFSKSMVFNALRYANRTTEELDKRLGRLIELPAHIRQRVEADFIAGMPADTELSSLRAAGEAIRPTLTTSEGLQKRAEDAAKQLDETLTPVGESLAEITTEAQDQVARAESPRAIRSGLLRQTGALLDKLDNVIGNAAPSLAGQTLLPKGTLTRLKNSRPPDSATAEQARAYIQKVEETISRAQTRFNDLSERARANAQARVEQEEAGRQLGKPGISSAINRSTQLGGGRTILYDTENTVAQYPVQFRPAVRSAMERGEMPLGPDHANLHDYSRPIGFSVRTASGVEHRSVAPAPYDLNEMEDFPDVRDYAFGKWAERLARTIDLGNLDPKLAETIRGHLYRHSRSIGGRWHRQVEDAINRQDAAEFTRLMLLAEDYAMARYLNRDSERDTNQSDPSIVEHEPQIGNSTPVLNESDLPDGLREFWTRVHAAVQDAELFGFEDTTDFRGIWYATEEGAKFATFVEAPTGPQTGSSLRTFADSPFFSVPADQVRLGEIQEGSNFRKRVLSTIANVSWDEDLEFWPEGGINVAVYHYDDSQVTYRLETILAGAGTGSPRLDLTLIPNPSIAAGMTAEEFEAWSSDPVAVRAAIAEALRGQIEATGAGAMQSRLEQIEEDQRYLRLLDELQRLQTKPGGTSTKQYAELRKRLRSKKAQAARRRHMEYNDRVMRERGANVKASAEQLGKNRGRDAKDEREKKVRVDRGTRGIGSDSPSPDRRVSVRTRPHKVANVEETVADLGARGDQLELQYYEDPSVNMSLPDGFVKIAATDPFHTRSQTVGERTLTSGSTSATRGDVLIVGEQAQDPDFDDNRAQLKRGTSVRERFRAHLQHYELEVDMEGNQASNEQAWQFYVEAWEEFFAERPEVLERLRTAVDAATEGRIKFLANPDAGTLDLFHPATAFAHILNKTNPQLNEAGTFLREQSELQSPAQAVLGLKRGANKGDILRKAIALFAERAPVLAWHGPIVEGGLDVYRSRNQPWITLTQKRRTGRWTLHILGETFAVEGQQTEYLLEDGGMIRVNARGIIQAAEGVTGGEKLKGKHVSRAPGFKNEKGEGGLTVPFGTVESTNRIRDLKPEEAFALVHRNFLVPTRGESVVRDVFERELQDTLKRPSIDVFDEIREAEDLVDEDIVIYPPHGRLKDWEVPDAVRTALGGAYEFWTEVKIKKSQPDGSKQLDLFGPGLRGVYIIRDSQKEGVRTKLSVYVKGSRFQVSSNEEAERTIRDELKRHYRRVSATIRRRANYTQVLEESGDIVPMDKDAFFEETYLDRTGVAVEPQTSFSVEDEALIQEQAFNATTGAEEARAEKETSEATEENEGERAEQRAAEAPIGRVGREPTARRQALEKARIAGGSPFLVSRPEIVPAGQAGDMYPNSLPHPKPDAEFREAELRKTAQQNVNDADVTIVLGGSRYSRFADFVRSFAADGTWTRSNDQAGTMEPTAEEAPDFPHRVHRPAITIMARNKDEAVRQIRGYLARRFPDHQPIINFAVHELDDTAYGYEGATAQYLHGARQIIEAVMSGTSRQDVTDQWAEWNEKTNTPTQLSSLEKAPSQQEHEGEEINYTEELQPEIETQDRQEEARELATLLADQIGAVREFVPNLDIALPEATDSEVIRVVQTARILRDSQQSEHLLQQPGERTSDYLDRIWNEAVTIVAESRGPLPFHGEVAGPTITEFQGEHRYLSNFHEAPITVDGKVYPTVEHAFQAAKTDSEEWKERIRLANTPGQAKRLGKQAPLRDGWNAQRVDVMRSLVAAKFAQHPELMAQLQATTGRLEEGNSWGDKFWGMVDGQGQNQLGQILMDIRGPKTGASVSMLSGSSAWLRRPMIGYGEYNGVAGIRRLAKLKSRIVNVKVLDMARLAADLRRRYTPYERELMTYILEDTDHPDLIGMTPDDMKSVIAQKQHGLDDLLRLEEYFANIRMELNDVLKSIGDAEYLRIFKNYVPHYFTRESVGHVFGDQGTNVKIRAAQTRRVMTYAGAIKMGLVPKSLDVTDLLRMYTEMNWSIVTARDFAFTLDKLQMENGQPMAVLGSHADPSAPVPMASGNNLRTRIRNFRNPRTEGEPLKREPTQNEGAWKNPERPYVQIQTDLVEGGSVMVHPDVANVVRMMMVSAGNPGRFFRGVEMFNIWAKRIQLYFSFFHHFALAESATALLGSEAARKLNIEVDGLVYTGHGFNLGKRLMENDMWRHDAQMHGLQFGMPATEVYAKTTQSLKALEKKVSRIPVVGNGVRLWIKAEEGFDSLLWDRMHNGWKALAYHQIVEAVAEKNPDMDLDLIKEAVADVVNRGMGGLEWKTQWWAAPNVQRYLRNMLLALDWTSANALIAPTELLGIDEVIRAATGRIRTDEERAADKIVFEQKMKRYWPRMIVILPLSSHLLQLLIYAASGPDPEEVEFEDSEGEKQSKKIDRMMMWAFQNEAGHGDLPFTDIDVTPIVRNVHKHIPFMGRSLEDYPNQRFYIHFGKQAREVQNWFRSFLPTLLSKASPAVKVIQEVGAVAMRKNAKYEHPHVDLKMWAAIPQGIKKQLIPFSFRENNFAFTAPMGKGMTPYKFKAWAEATTMAYADPSFYNDHQHPDYYPQLEQMHKELIVAAERNGIDWQTELGTAMSNSRSKFYQKFWHAYRDGDQKELDAAARSLIRLHIQWKSFTTAMKDRAGKYPLEEFDEAMRAESAHVLFRAMEELGAKGSNDLFYKSWQKDQASRR